MDEFEFKAIGENHNQGVSFIDFIFLFSIDISYLIKYLCVCVCVCASARMCMCELCLAFFRIYSSNFLA